MSLRMKDKKGWFYSYNYIFKSGLSNHAKLVYVYLCRCANRELRSFPSKQNIMDACSIGRTTAGKAIRDLEAARLLVREERFRENNGQKSNEYLLFEYPYEADEY